MITRLTTVANVIHFWDFISQSLKSLEDRMPEPFDLEAVRKTLIHLAPDQTHSWLGVALHEGEPVAFAVCQESTQLFDLKRTFVVRWFFHAPTHFNATFELMKEFESWAKEHGVTAYGVTTARNSGAAIRCFQSEKFGFRKSHITFEKHIA